MARPNVILEPPHEGITTQLDSVDSFVWSASTASSGIAKPPPSRRGHRTIRQNLAAALGAFFRYTRKVEYYLRAGVRLVWIVDPGTQRITVYRSLQDIRILSAEQELDGGEIIPGFRINIAQIFDL